MIEPRKFEFEEYRNFLSQQYWLASHTEFVMKLASANCHGLNLDVLEKFFYLHANEEAHHHRWAYFDLCKLGEELQPTKPETVELIDNLLDQCTNKETPYSVLGLSLVVENFSASLTVEEICPAEAIQLDAVEFCREHFLLDKKHAKDVNDIYARLVPERKAVVDRAKIAFDELYDAFLEASIL